MTGREVRELRELFGVRAATFAGLCGVNLSTVHRWEGAQHVEVKPEPFSRAMLAVLQGLGEKPELGEKLERAYQSHGALYAIYEVLRLHFHGH